MRPKFLHRAALRRYALLLPVCALGGCLSAVAPTTYVRQDRSMPPNTVLLSTMMSDLTAQPGFFDRMMDSLGRQSKTGAAIYSPKMQQAIRVAMARDWKYLDHFPGWKMRDINPVEDLSGNIDQSVAWAPARPLTAYIDLGDYALNPSPGPGQRVDLDFPSTLPGFSLQGLVAPLGNGVVSSDGPNPAIAPLHSESMRLAEMLNRLSLNRLEGAAPTIATLGGKAAQTPEDLLRALLATGHEVTVSDARYFANFGHLHYEGMDVMMPFWVNAQVWIPGTQRQLLVPVAHAEYEWFVRGPRINADVAFYFGVDGKAEFRTMDQLDQTWVMGRHAHEYRGADAVEVTRLAGLLVLAYAHEHLDHPNLPFGGYYALGVCQDGVAAIEKKMKGNTTLFPNTADMTLFKDPRDAEINMLLSGIPKDRSGEPPQLERIFGSLPTTDLAAITIPGLAPDLESVQAAWHHGIVQRRRRLPWKTSVVSLIGVAAALLVSSALRRRHRSRAVAP